jgi:hypothetical protein
MLQRNIILWVRDKRLYFTTVTLMSTSTFASIPMASRGPQVTGWAPICACTSSGYIPAEPKSWRTRIFYNGQEVNLPFVAERHYLLHPRLYASTFKKIIQSKRQLVPCYKTSKTIRHPGRIVSGLPAF